MNNPVAKIKDRLQLAINIRNITAKELATKTNIPKSSISQYMSGYAQPKQDRLYLMSEALNINPAWLLGYDVSMEINGLHNQVYKNGNSNESYNELITLIDNNVHSLDIVSSLCKSTRIEQKLLEEDVAKKAGISLDDYLLFEEIGNSLSAESAINILDALDISYSYAIGYINALQKGNLYKLLKDPLTRSIVERITALDEDQLRLLKTRLENLIKE